MIIVQQAIRWLVHWALMGGLLHLVQRGGDWAARGRSHKSFCTRGTTMIKFSSSSVSFLSFHTATVSTTTAEYYWVRSFFMSTYYTWPSTHRHSTPVMWAAEHSVSTISQHYIAFQPSAGGVRFLSCDAMHTRALRRRTVSVRPSVYHVPVFYRNQ